MLKFQRCFSNHVIPIRAITHIFPLIRYLCRNVQVSDFIEGYTAPTPTPAPTVQIQLPTPAPTPQVITVEPEKKETSLNSYALIGVLALAVIGGGWYFKVYKPKHEDYDDDDEGMEYDDSDEERDDD